MATVFLFVHTLSTKITVVKQHPLQLVCADEKSKKSSVNESYRLNLRCITLVTSNEKDGLNYGNKIL